MKKLLIITWLLFCASVSYAGTLVISPSLFIQYDEPQEISHSGDTILLRYKKGFFTHLSIGPNDIYQGIDLTGLERDFIMSLFFPERREKLPEWLAVLAKNQAEAFNTQGKTTIRQSIGGSDLLAAYDKEGQLGNVFILEDRHIHHLQMSGDLPFYRQIISWIKER